MSRAEAERERREDEGDPRLRAEQRRRQRALARDPLVDDVARAGLVVTAEGVAVALRLVDGLRARGRRRRRAAARQRHHRRGAAARHRRARRRQLAAALAALPAGATVPAELQARALAALRAVRRADVRLIAMLTRVAQSGHPRRRPRHALSAGDQGDPEGDAADRRRPDAAADRRGGGRRRHRGDRARHRARQVLDRGPLRSQLRARAHAARARQDRARRRMCERISTDGAAGDSVRQKEPLGLGHAVLVRARRPSATSRSRCCSATISIDSEGGRPAIGQLIDEFERLGGDKGVIALMEVPAGQEHHVRHRQGQAGRRRAGRDARSTTWSRSRRRERRRRGWRSSGATCCRRRSGSILAQTKPGKGGEIQLTDGLKELAQRGGGLLRRSPSTARATTPATSSATSAPTSPGRSSATICGPASWR